MGEPGLLPGSWQRPPSCGGGRERCGWGGAGGGAVWAQELPHLGSWLQDENEGESPALLRVVRPLRLPRRREEARRKAEGGAGIVWHASCPGRSRLDSAVPHQGWKENWWSQGRGSAFPGHGPKARPDPEHRALVLLRHLACPRHRRRIGADALIPRGALFWGQEPSRSLHRRPGAKEQIKSDIMLALASIVSG